MQMFIYYANKKMFKIMQYYKITIIFIRHVYNLLTSVLLYAKLILKFNKDNFTLIDICLLNLQKCFAV